MKVKIVSPVRHNGDDMLPGEKVNEEKFKPKELEALINCGAVERLDEKAGQEKESKKKD